MHEDIAAPKVPRKPPKCVECGERAHLHQHDEGLRWVCDCGAYAHCKPDSLLPGARPCADETREARRAAHDACRVAGERTAETQSSKNRWAAINRARYHAAKAMGLHYRDFQFGWMTLAEANQAREFFEAYSE